MLKRNEDGRIEGITTMGDLITAEAMGEPEYTEEDLQRAFDEMEAREKAEQ